MSKLNSLTLPIVDFAHLSSGAGAERTALLENLGQAARDVGFFYLINHGIDRELLDNVQLGCRVAAAWFLRGEYRGIAGAGNQWLSARHGASCGIAAGGASAPLYGLFPWRPAR